MKPRLQHQQPRGCSGAATLDDDAGLRSAAFAVSGVLPPEYGAVRNGVDHLRRARWEAQQLPPVRVAAVVPRCAATGDGEEDEKTLHPEIVRARELARQEKAASTPGETKLREWFGQMKKQCQDARAKALGARRKKVGAESLCPLCSAKDGAPTATGTAAEGTTEATEERKTVEEKVFGASVVSLGLVLEHLCEHCGDSNSNENDISGEQEEHDEDKMVQLAKLLFCVLCVVDEPLLPDDAAALNCLCRWCSQESARRAGHGEKQAANALALVAALIPAVSRA